VRGDTEQTFLGHATLGVAELYRATFASSLAHCERALVLYDSVRHERFAQLFGPDPAVAMEDHAAVDLWFLGRSDAALTRAREAVAIARRVGHPFSVAFALFFESLVHCYRRDPGAQRECATEVIALSEAKGFPLYVGLGRAMHAIARVMDGEPGALPEIMEGLALVTGTGSQTGAPGFMLLLAGAQQIAGQLDAAQATVATGLAVAAQTGQPVWDADLHRLDGELLLALGGVADEAAARYTRALDVAREYGARSHELRAATSLARLWRQQGKRAEARDLLGPVYEWFTEGFETRDLKEAKALLAEL
jgi:predicted ATPase